MSTIEKYMRWKVITIDSEATAFDASKAMRTNKIGYLVIVKSDKPIGMITESDLVLKVMAEDRDQHRVKVSEFMSSPLVTIEPGKHVEDAVELMKRHKFRRLPVVKDNVVYGIFSTKDLLEHYKEFEDELMTGSFYLTLANQEG